MKNYKKVKKRKNEKKDYLIREIDIGRMNTRAGLSLPEGLGANNSIFRLILSNNLLYNLCSFA